MLSPTFGTYPLTELTLNFPASVALADHGEPVECAGVVPPDAEGRVRRWRPACRRRQSEIGRGRGGHRSREFCVIDDIAVAKAMEFATKMVLPLLMVVPPVKVLAPESVNAPVQSSQKRWARCILDDAGETWCSYCCRPR